MCFIYIYVICVLWYDDNIAELEGEDIPNDEEEFDEESAAFQKHAGKHHNHNNHNNPDHCQA